MEKITQKYQRALVLGCAKPASEMNSTLETRRSIRRFLIGICIFAFALRVTLVLAAGTYKVSEDEDHFGFGWEMGRVARSLAESRGFSSPLPLPSGFTAMVGPVYPILLAAIFKVFGVYSTASAIAARVLQSGFSSATCVFIYLCGRDTGSDRVGRWAAIVWAVFPLNIFFTIMKVWETSLTALLMAALFWLMLSSRNMLSVKRWVAIGAILGVAALTNTSLVILVVPFGLFALWKHRVRSLGPLLVGALSCVAVVSPWLIRNYIKFDKFMLRSNFPLEFRIGNNDLSFGQKIESFHPSNTPSLNEHWSQVGESQFMEEEREANSRFLTKHLGRFVLATLNRVVNYWTGAWILPIEGYSNEWSVIIGISTLSVLGCIGLCGLMSSRNPIGILYLGCLLLYPLVYCVTTTQPRFYHALTPLLISLAVYWAVSFWDKFGEIASAHKRRRNQAGMQKTNGVLQISF